MANELWNVTVFPEPTTVGKNRKGEKPTEALQKGTAKTHEADATARTRRAPVAFDAPRRDGMTGPRQIH